MSWPLPNQDHHPEAQLSSIVLAAYTASQARQHSLATTRLEANASDRPSGVTRLWALQHQYYNYIARAQGLIASHEGMYTQILAVQQTEYDPPRCQHMRSNANFQHSPPNSGHSPVHACSAHCCNTALTRTTEPAPRPRQHCSLQASPNTARHWGEGRGSALTCRNMARPAAVALEGHRGRRRTRAKKPPMH